MKKLKTISALVLSALIFAGSFMTAQAEEGYTYNYDYWGDVQYSPDTYNVAAVVTAADMGLETPMKSPQGLFAFGDMLYICDSGNNRIVEVKRLDDTVLKVQRVITEFKGAEVNTFSNPTDIAVTEDGYLFICDQNNNRVLKLDMDLNYVMQFTKPDDANFDQELDFLPDKLAVDSAGRVYCLAINVNKGTIKFEADGVFSGFIGATPVTYNWTDYLKKRFSTKAQRAQLESFVPTEYDNIYMDHEGFIYAVTSNVSEADVDSGKANPVRRLNLMGNDILIRNGEWPVIGDIYWGEAGGYKGISLMQDITAFENDVYVCLDRNRGRLFAYDEQGRLLCAFGGNGNMDGYFKQPTALEHMGHDLFVLDALDNSITIFMPTTFGSLIFQAIEQFQDGYYTESGETWKEVMELNGNYDLAYIGIGRSLLRQEKYKEAMEYFELKYDEDNYSRAFKQYRKEWVEENIGWLVALAFAVLILPLAIGRLKRIKFEIDTADIFRE